MWSRCMASAPSQFIGLGDLTALTPSDRIGDTIHCCRNGAAHQPRTGRAGSQAVKPGIAIYSHIASFGNSTADLVRRTRVTYTGPLEVGGDLMQVEVGESPIVRRQARRKWQAHFSRLLRPRSYRRSAGSRVP